MSSSALSQHKSGRGYLALIGAVFAKIGRARQRQRAIAALHQLSDYQLQDLGIGRSEIIRSVEKGRLHY